MHTGASIEQTLLERGLGLIGHRLVNVNGMHLQRVLMDQNCSQESTMAEASIAPQILVLLGVLLLGPLGKTGFQ